LKTRAAIAFAQGAPLEIREIDLAPPGQDEVLVKMEACGICHTDVTAWQRYPASQFPIVFGHEGAGTVIEIGQGVTDLAPGDRVLLSGAGACGECTNCRAGRHSLCQRMEPFRFSGALPGGHHRISLDGQPLNHFMLQSAFAEHAVVPKQVAIKVPVSAPLRQLAHIGCAGITGLGCAIHAAPAGPETSVAVFGCGSVGLCAVIGAKLAGAREIVAVDVVPAKLDLAKEFGATVIIDASQTDPVEAIRAAGIGGADRCIVATNHGAVMAQAVEAAAPAGVIIFVAAPSPADYTPISFYSIMSGEKALKGSVFGSGNARLDIPKYVELCLAGELPVDRIVTRYYPLDEINRGFGDLTGGEIIKGVIVFD
jgi:S-(hydroxymethyl)glutathione dehydrogenase / alcohol dehydrogenase